MTSRDKIMKQSIIRDNPLFIIRENIKTSYDSQSNKKKDENKGENYYRIHKAEPNN